MNEGSFLESPQTAKQGRVNKPFLTEHCQDYSLSAMAIAFGIGVVLAGLIITGVALGVSFSCWLCAFGCVYRCGHISPLQSCSPQPSCKQRDKTHPLQHNKASQLSLLDHPALPQQGFSNAGSSSESKRDGSPYAMKNWGAAARLKDLGAGEKRRSVGADARRTGV